MVLSVTTTLDVPGLLRPVRLRETRDMENVPLRTGCRVWSCARLLARWLAAEHSETDATLTARTQIRDKHILELGAGVGAVGFVCALLGAKSVTLTDRDEATLALMHANAQLNGFYDGDCAGACEVSVQKLDWGDKKSYLSCKYDLIVAADVLYLPEHCAALPNAVCAHLKPGGKVVVACGLRRTGLIDLLIAAFTKNNLTPRVDYKVLSLDNLSVDLLTQTTATEHAHDGEQIKNAGGYVLLTCDAPAGWRPPADLSATADEETGSDCETSDDESQTIVPSVSKPPGPISHRRVHQAIEVGVPSEETDDSTSELGSETNSLMGDFLDDFCDAEVGGDCEARSAHKTRIARVDDDHDEEEEVTVDLNFPPYRVQVTQQEQIRGYPTQHTIDTASESLTRNGFVVLDPPSGADAATETFSFHGLVTETSLDKCEVATTSYLDTLMKRCRDLSIDPFSDIVRFKEVCGRVRGGKRLDVTAERRRDAVGDKEKQNKEKNDPDADRETPIVIHPGGGPPEAMTAAADACAAWQLLRQESDPWVTPVLQRSGLMEAETETSSSELPTESNSPDQKQKQKKTVSGGNTTAVGCVVSYPHAPAQHFHADGRERGIVNVFLPLRDVTRALGPTSFKLGSHHWDHECQYPDRAAKRLAATAVEVTPELKKGALLLYDYRVMHRGGANATDAQRPVAYVMKSRPGLTDTWNFPRNSIWDEDEDEGGSH
jgi:predicted nicotinamide N-methyase